MANINTLLDEQVTLALESIDRLYLNGYIPTLQTPGQLIGFLVNHRGYRIPSPALLGALTKEWVAAVERFASERGIEIVRFEKGERKEQVARPYLEAAERERRFGVVMIGVAQEGMSAFRSYRSKAYSGFDFCRGSVFVNTYYFYIHDRCFGPSFIKIGSYLPFPVKVWLNGHQWAKRRAQAEGIAFEALDNGFACCAEPERLQAICRSLRAADVRRFFAYWMSVIPQPLTRDDRKAGYRHELSVRQCELSLTHVFSRPLAGRQFFEQALVEALSLGRPHEIGLLFGRRVNRRTPGRFHSRIVTRGCEPTLKLHYKHSSLRQYFKAERALRTETTINDAYDFGIGKRLVNLPALREVGAQANRRLLDVQRISHDPVLGETSFARLTSPLEVDGQRASALRFADLRSQRLLSALVVFRLQAGGFRAADLRRYLAPLLGLRPDELGQGRLSYELRRLRPHGLIERIPKSHGYRLTELGFRTALFFTRAYARLLRPGFAQLVDPRPMADRRLRQPFEQLERAIDRWTTSAKLAS